VPVTDELTVDAGLPDTDGVVDGVPLGVPVTEAVPDPVAVTDRVPVGVPVVVAVEVLGGVRVEDEVALDVDVGVPVGRASIRTR